VSETPAPIACKDCGERPRRPGRSYCDVCQRLKYGRMALSAKSPEARRKRISENHDRYTREKYGLSLAEANVVRSRDCEVCGRPGPNCVDHEEDGAFLGTLCRGCNINLTRFYPYHHLYLAAKAYWERTRPGRPFRTPYAPLEGRKKAVREGGLPG
jgi:hypothetical protein